MNENYTQKLIIKLCSKPRTLDYITSHLHGIDPISIFKYLEELEKREILRHQEGLWLVEENARKEIIDLLDPNPELYLKKYMGDFNIFRKPHPLDFEWRNTRNSVNYFSDLVLEDASIDDNILVLGMPTLFANLCKRDIPQKVTIVERNVAVIDSLKELSRDNCKVIEADVFKINPDTLENYSTVIMDPPWYEEDFFQFIWVASQCLKLGGRLIISIPQMNTRPGIAAERVRWFKFSEEQGLCLYNLIPNKLEYAMPFFEWNAARIAGAVINPFWRNGDVAIFHKLELKAIERPSHTEDENKWKEIEFEDCRIRIQIDCNEEDSSEDDLDIEILVPLQILPSVSSREPIRKQANIWTSGNRIFKTNKTKNVYTHLRNIKDGVRSNSNEEKEVFDFFCLISGCESKEYDQYLEWLYHYMESESS